MFRTNQNSGISPNKFGVGSVIKGGKDKKWLVAGALDSEGKCVLVIDLNTFMVVGWANSKVDDLNFMTEKEVRSIVDSTVGNQLNWTFTDFDLDAKGIK